VIFNYHMATEECGSTIVVLNRSSHLHLFSQILN
jgi:hypothetical protein